MDNIFLGQREYRSLLSISDNRPKYVVTMDDMDWGAYEGIQWVSAIEVSDII